MSPDDEGASAPLAQSLLFVPDMMAFFNCDRKTIYRKIHSGALPMRQLGGTGPWFITVADFERFLLSLADPPAPTEVVPERDTTATWGASTWQS